MRRVGAGLLLAVAAYLFLGPVTGVFAPRVQASCGLTCIVIWRLQAVSTCGACTTLGTAEFGSLPSQWSVPQDPNQYDNMNEAAWLLQKNSGAGTETGYFSGWWPYTNPASWVHTIVAYGTGNAASIGFYSNGLTSGASFNSYVDATGQESVFWQNGSIFWSCYCWSAIGTPRYNSAQGEIHASDTDQYGTPWLGNGSGQTFNMEYQAASGSWNLWSSLTLQNAGALSPYWYTKQANWEWSNGGY